MQKIIVLGAGKSSSVLIRYLASRATSHGYTLLVADASQHNLDERASGLPNIKTFCGDLNNTEVLGDLVSSAGLVISLLPPYMHPTVAKLCLLNGKHLLTASYVSEEMKALHQEALSKNLTFLMECGLDPGLDHMSAMHILDDLKEKGARIDAFRSYCGGLVAPECNDNPWKYKITWNPRNVVLAGKGVAQYLDGGEIKYVPYHQLFKQAEPLRFEEIGEYETYPNRDSLSYIQTYGLQQAKTFVRGTIREKGFCIAWHQLVALGLTEDLLKIEGKDLTTKGLVSKFLPKKVSLIEYLGLEPNKEVVEKLKWLGLFDEQVIGVSGPVSPADCLQRILEDKWKLKESDKDLVLMQHQIDYFLDGKNQKLVSELAVKGTNSLDTAMAKTVGLPLAIAALFLYDKKIKEKGVITPILKEIYNPVLEELKNNALIFREYTYS